MKADAQPLTKLYDTHNKAYVIPSYQRPFAWEPKKAIALLDAILEDAESGVNLTSLGTLLFCEVQNTTAHHPNGNNTPTTEAPTTIWEVVDGQQRLTVFSIIGFALDRRHQALATSGLQYSPALEFSMLVETSRTKRSKPVPVLIRDEDNFDTGYTSDVAHLLESFINVEQYPPQIGVRLIETVTEVERWVAEKLRSDDGSFVKFSDHLLSKCQVIQVVADDQDTAFRMFEPLNSTSEPLTAFEVYRSKAIKSIQPAPSFAQTLSLLDYDNTDRDVVIKKSNTLIFAMAQAVSGARPRIHFVPLKGYLDSHVASAFVDRFEVGAEFFRTIWLEQTSGEAWFDDETKNCVRFLKASSHDVVIPLALRYFQSNKQDLPAVLKVVVAFYALWRTTFPTNMLPDTYRTLLKEGSPDNMAMDGGTLKTPQQLASYFRGKLTDRLQATFQGVQPKDAWVANPRFLEYEGLKTICRLFIFLQMGASIKSNLVPNDPWTSADDVDHILASGTQPAPNNVHQIGNLTFLPGTVNKSLQAAPWVDKRQVYDMLASPVRANPPPTTYSDGRQLPPAVRDYLAQASSPSLAHLGPLASSVAWGQVEIAARTTTMLTTVWDLLYGRWLHP